MILEGKVKKGLGNANFWIKKIENIFYSKTGIKLFHGTLNIELETPYELENYWIIGKDEYGGKQKAYIVRSEKTAHKSNVIEIVSDVNFRKNFNLKDEDYISVKI